jgi:(5-formylfuran-3-yl)methyl phosphate synthase
MPLTQAQPAFLASVTSPAEATLALAGGADIIDAKNPLLGAYGALPIAVVQAIRQATPARIAVSATIGEGSDDHLLHAATRMAALTQCTFIKVAMPSGRDCRALIHNLGQLNLGDTRLVGMLLADQSPDLRLIAAMADAGFVGVMLDTADKSAGALPDVCTAAALSHFVTTTQNAGLFAGVAGALRLSHVADLVQLKPNVIGFRGALCVGANRTQSLCGDAVKAVRRQMDETMAAAYATRS